MPASPTLPNLRVPVAIRFVIMCCPGREAMVRRLRESLEGAIVLEVWDAKREGNVPCALHAFEMGLAAFKGEPFTVLQDDAELCAGFVEYVDTFTKDIRELDLVIQWYAHPWVAPKCQRDDRPTFYRHWGGNYLVSVATTYSAKWAEKIRARLADAVENDTRDDHGQLHGDDHRIADTLDFHGGAFWVHVPSLVQHIGDVSMVAGRKVSLASHDARQSRCYVGRGFDARSLTPNVIIPWAQKPAKERIMDDTSDTIPVLPAPTEVPKLVGEMTAAELYAALMELENADRDKTDGRHLATEHAQELTANARTLAAVTTSAVPVVCNECGAPESTCGHGG